MPAREIQVSGRAPLSAHAAAEVVRAVLDRERRDALISVRFVGRDRMRALHHRHKGVSRVTDVLAFSLHGPHDLAVGDIYVCVWVAAREARSRGIPVREELIRYLVHGVLHVLGYQHPDDASRVRGPMWRKQERYVAALA